MAQEEQQLLLYWLNSLDIPSALLVDGIEDLADGSVIVDCIARLQSMTKTDAQAPVRNLNEALHWVTEVVGWSSLPVELRARNAADGIRAGHPGAITAALRVLRDMFQRVAVLPVTPAKQHHQHNAEEQKPSSAQRVGLNGRPAPVPGTLAARARFNMQVMQSNASTTQAIEKMSRQATSAADVNGKATSKTPVKRVHWEDDPRPAPVAATRPSTATKRRPRAAAAATAAPTASIQTGWNASTAVLPDTSKNSTSSTSSRSTVQVAPTTSDGHGLTASLAGTKVTVADGTLKVNSMVDPTYSAARIQALVQRFAPPPPPAPAPPTAPRTPVTPRHAPAPAHGTPKLGIAAATRPSTPWTKQAGYQSDSDYESDEDTGTSKLSGPKSTPRFKMEFSSSALDEQQKRIIQWAKSLGVDIAKPTPQGTVTIQSVATAFANGIALCELVAGAESRAGSRLPLVHMSDIDGNNRLTLPGAATNVKSAAAMGKNITLALQVLRENAHMPTRRLWSGEDLKRGDVDAVWDLLEDMFKCYGPKPKRSKTASGKQHTQDVGSMPLPPPPPPAMPQPVTPGAGHKRAAPAHTVAPPVLPQPVTPKQQTGQAWTVSSQAPRSAPRATTTQPMSSSAMYMPAGTGASSGALTIGASGPVHQAQGNSNPSKARKPASDMRVAGEVPVNKAVVDTTSPAVYPPLEEYQISQIRSWLHRIGLSVNKEAEGTYVLENPYCNGVVLCRLATLLTPCVIKFHKAPRSLAAARGNLMAALSAFRDYPGAGSPIPSKFLWNTEDMLKGNFDVIWGLLFHIYAAYPGTADVASEPSGVVADTHSVALPYTVEQLWRLERSVLSWMFSLGVLRDMTPRGVPQDLQDLRAYLADGTLLCEVAKVMGVTPVGTFNRPRTPNTRISNIEKACRALRSLPNMAHLPLTDISGLAKVDRHAWLAALEACHRCYDGVAPITPSLAIGPYFGSHAPPASVQVPVSAPDTQTWTATSGPTPHYSSHLPMFGTSDADLFPSALLGAGSAAADVPSGVELHPMAPHELPMRLNFGASDPRPAVMEPTRIPVHVHRRPLEATSMGAAVDQRAVSLAATAQASMSMTALQQRQLSPLRASGVGVKAVSETVPSLMTTHAPSDATTNGRDAATVGSLVEWMSTIGVVLKRPWELMTPTASEFSDGLVLCKVVELVEHIRGGIPGVERAPKSAAHRLQNIRRALEVLRNHKSMPMDHLWSEMAIRDGDTNIIVPLFLQIRKAYGHHLGHGAA